MKKTYLTLFLSSLAIFSFGQNRELNRSAEFENLCNTVSELAESLSNESSNKNAVAFPGAIQSAIKNINGNKAFIAQLAESNDKNQLIDDYKFFYEKLINCLGSDFVVEERLKDEGLGQVMSAWKSTSKTSGLRVFLEFSKSNLSNASYQLNLSIKETSSK